jgi:aldehyde:ferredoxin oxidoreductase
MDFDLKKEADLIRGIMGMDIADDELLKLGERVLHLERLVNLKMGASSKDDVLPKMFQEVPVPSGPNKGQKIINFSAAVKKYFDTMGWNTEGVPKQETLHSCGLALILKSKNPSISR